MLELSRFFMLSSSTLVLRMSSESRARATSSRPAARDTAFLSLLPIRSAMSPSAFSNSVRTDATWTSDSGGGGGTSPAAEADCGPSPLGCFFLLFLPFFFFESEESMNQPRAAAPRPAPIRNGEGQIRPGRNARGRVNGFTATRPTALAPAGTLALTQDHPVLVFVFTHLAVLMDLSLTHRAAPVILSQHHLAADLTLFQHQDQKPWLFFAAFLVVFVVPRAKFLRYWLIDSSSVSTRWTTTG